MLFSVDNYFWKSLLVVGFSWILYVLWGFEFTIITLMALILVKNK